jgi:hypothetical protein
MTIDEEFTQVRYVTFYHSHNENDYYIVFFFSKLSSELYARLSTSLVFDVCCENIITYCVTPRQIHIDTIRSFLFALLNGLFVSKTYFFTFKKNIIAFVFLFVIAIALYKEERFKLIPLKKVLKTLCRLLALPLKKGFFVSYDFTNDKLIFFFRRYSYRITSTWRNGLFSMFIECCITF